MKSILIILCFIFITSCTEEKVVYVENDIDINDYTILGKWYVEAGLYKFVDGYYEFISNAGSDTLTLYLKNRINPEYEYQKLNLKISSNQTLQTFEFIEDLKFPYTNVTIESQNIIDSNFTFFKKSFKKNYSNINLYLDINDDETKSFNYNTLNIEFTDFKEAILGVGTRIK